MLGSATQVLIPSAMAFVLGIALAPFLAATLYHKKAWKKAAGKEGIGGGGTPIFNELHKEREVSTPRMGGMLIWISVLATALLFWTLARTLDTFWPTLDFVNRRETWLPLFALACGALAGLVDDLLEIREGRGGLSLLRRLAIVGTIGAIAGWWFYAKLAVDSIGLPFFGPLPLGILIVPFFALVTLAIYAGGTIDGIDGLAGGVFAIIFMVYAGIAFGEGSIRLRPLPLWSRARLSPSFGSIFHPHASICLRRGVWHSRSLSRWSPSPLTPLPVVLVSSYSRWSRSP